MTENAESMPMVSLNDGRQMPKIGYGLGMLRVRDATDRASTANSRRDVKANLEQAFKTGYTMIDAAQMYLNNVYLGEAITSYIDGGGKREDLYILQKCGNSAVPKSQNDPRKILKQLLEENKIDYVDMYLLHQPILFESLPVAWAIMEQLQEEGLARSIGVSNFREEDIEEISKGWKVPPAINQRLLSLSSTYGIITQAYGPLSPIVHFPNGPVDAVVEQIAKANDSEPSQVLLQWAAQHTEGAVLTTSNNASRQKLQLEAITKLRPLSDTQIKDISEAGSTVFHRKFCIPVWEDARE